LKIKRLMIALLLLLSLTGFTKINAGCDHNSLDGVWKTEGYGLILEAEHQAVNIYQTTSISGFKAYQGTYNDNSIQLSNITINYKFENDSLIIYHPYSGTRYQARRLAALPQFCKDGGTPETADPILNFEIFWRTFNEQYAFFQLRGVNWEHQYCIYRPQITKYTTPSQLFAIMCQMVQPLNDSHVSISDPKNEKEYNIGYDSEVIKKAKSMFLAREGVNRIGSQDYLAYQYLANNIALITVFAEFGYADSTDLEAEGKAIDQVIEALANQKAIIIDLRNNEGGLDTIARLFAGRFADQKRLAYSKQARNGSGYTQLTDYYVEPQGPRQYHGKVIVLTSRNTVSAGEILVMCLKVLPNVTVIGEATNGCHSDALSWALPNGFNIGLANERYYAADHQIYEKIGLQPDVFIPYDFDAVLQGKDHIMEAAIEYIEK
jgi:carboxyl-terminal processing protease